MREAFAREQPSLLALPENPYPCELQLAVQVNKTPYVRFDLNDYTIPHTHVRRTLAVRADAQQVRILDGANLLATHERSYDRGAQNEIAAHIEGLVERKREARHHRGLDHLSRAAPASQAPMLRAAEQAAIEESLASGTAPHPKIRSVWRWSAGVRHTRRLHRSRSRCPNTCARKKRS
ncbi:Integrase catalytic subunit IS 21 family (plasmid) [Candidatus Burkholderia crenata]|nr:Integrase catalytic subunit IS 21 family [Candidatus Burkholderia crenata]